MKTITYSDGDYAHVPLEDLPFSGDYIMKDADTEEIVWDSRKDGYDPDGTYLVKWIELIRDDSRTVGSIYLFHVYHEDRFTKAKRSAEIEGGN